MKVEVRQIFADVAFLVKVTNGVFLKATDSSPALAFRDLQKWTGGKVWLAVRGDAAVYESVCQILWRYGVRSVCGYTVKDSVGWLVIEFPAQRTDDIIVILHSVVRDRLILRELAALRHVASPAAEQNANAPAGTRASICSRIINAIRSHMAGR